MREGREKRELDQSPSSCLVGRFCSPTLPNTPQPSLLRAEL